jgi:hypothetical protein
MFKPLKHIADSNKKGPFLRLQRQFVKGQKRYPFVELQDIFEKYNLKNGWEVFSFI